MKKDQHDLGIVTDDELRQVTIRMLGRDALPKTPSMSPKAIIALRERLGVSQAVFGGYLNVETQTVSMWERGARKPTGTALKLLQIVKNRGLEVLQ